MLKKMVSVLLCITVVLVGNVGLTVKASDGAGAPLNLIFSDVIYSGLAKDYSTTSATKSVTLADGTNITIAGKGEVKIVDTATGFVTNSASGNKYLQITEKGATARLSDTLTLTLPQAMKENFVLEFNFAQKVNNVSGLTLGETNNDQRVSLNGFINKSMTNGTNESRIMGLCDNGRYFKGQISTGAYTGTAFTFGSTNLFYQGASSTSTDFANQFQAIRVETTFHGTTSVPTMNIYRKHPSQSSYKLIAESVPYTSQFYSWSNAHVNVTAADYVANGINKFGLDLKGLIGATATASDTVTYAIDDVSVSPLVEPVTVGIMDLVDFNSASSSSLAKDFTTTNLAKTVTFGDGTKIDIAGMGEAKISNTTDGFVTNSETGNKYLQVTEKGATTQLKDRLTMTLPKAVKENFVFEFKLAEKQNNVSGIARYDTSGYKLLSLNGHINKAMSTGTNESAIMGLCYNERYYRGNISTGDYTGTAFSFEPTNIFYQGTSQTNTEFANQFQTIRVETTFHGTTSVPTMNIYRKHPSQSSYKLIAESVPYTFQFYGWNGAASHVNVTAADYVTNGINQFSFDLRGFGATNATASDTVTYAIDDLSILPLVEPVTIGIMDLVNFNSANSSSLAKDFTTTNLSKTVTFEDGTIIDLAGKGEVKISNTTDGFVTNSEIGNNYLQVTEKGATEQLKDRLTITLPKPMKENFIFEFKLAEKQNNVSGIIRGDTDNYQLFSINGHINKAVANGTNESRIMGLCYNERYCTGKILTGAYTGTAFSFEPTNIFYQGSSSITSEFANQFQTIRIETTFHGTTSVPTMNIYRKHTSQSNYELIAESVPYTSQFYNWSNAHENVTAADYVTNGINQFSFDLRGFGATNATASDTVTYAIDDLIVTLPQEVLTIGNFGMSDGTSAIAAGSSLVGKTLYPDINIVNHLSANKDCVIIIALYNADRELQSINLKTFALVPGENIIDSADGISLTSAGIQSDWYVKMYAWENMGNINPLTSAFTSEALQ